MIRAVKSSRLPRLSLKSPRDVTPPTLAACDEKDGRYENPGNLVACPHSLHARAVVSRSALAFVGH